MATFFITFGSGMYGGLYTNSYALIEADDEALARNWLYETIGSHYAFIYPEYKLANAKSEYGLTEVPLQYIIDLYTWANVVIAPRFVSEEG